MKIRERIKTLYQAHTIFILSVLAVIIWGVCYQDFIFNRLFLIRDANAYYEHFRYYIDNLSRGVFPLWEPSRDMGVPTEFFLRRIGDFNPFYLIILILNKIGIPYTIAYLFFLVIYYFVAMTAFYLIGKLIFKDKTIAWVAFLLLSFSSLGTLLFCSFTNFFFTPMIWFFYFLIAFSQRQERYAFLGMVFCVMLMLTTYIPFYFVTIFGMFVFFFTVLYFNTLKRFGIDLFRFSFKNKIFCALCISLVLLSLVPGYLFYKDSKKGELVLPTRNYNATTEDIFGVPIQRGDFGGLVPHLIISELYFDLPSMMVSRVYLPMFTHFMMFLALVVALNRRLALLYLWCFSLFLLALYDARLYKFLYHHIFYFKYFRNFQFFFWLGMLQLMVFFCAEQLRVFLNHRPGPKEKYFMVMAAILIHSGFLALLISQKSTIVASYAVTALSLAFFLCFLFGKIRWTSRVILPFLLIIIVLEPLEVYPYLSKNSVPSTGMNPYRYGDKKPYLSLTLPTQEELERIKKNEISPEQKDENRNPKDRTESAKLPSVYMGAVWYDFLFQNFDRLIVERFISNPLMVYDRIEWLDDKKMDFDRVEHAMAKFENVAFVAKKKDEKDDRLDIFMSLGPNEASDETEIITKESPYVQILGNDINYVKLKTNYPAAKFLVYQDNFNSGWMAYINGRPAPIWRANISFKGIKLPPGENIVYFRYGSRGQYAFKFFMMSVFYGTLCYLIWSWRRSYKLNPN